MAKTWHPFRRLACVTTLVALSGLLASAGPALAEVSIGRASADGTAVNPVLINQAGGGAAGDIAVAGDRLYWLAGDSIARAGLDGSDVELEFITGLGSPSGLTAGGGYLYWGGPAIGRARLDGTGVEPSLMTPSGGARDVAANGQYVYWTSDVGIGRANLDGTGANPAFIDTGVHESTPEEPQLVSGPSQVAINRTRVFWVYEYSESGIPQYNALGRANLDGSGAEYPFFERGIGLHPERYGPLGADDSRVFFRFSSWGSWPLGDEINSVDANFASDSPTGCCSPSWPANDDGGFAGGVAVERGQVYWAHEADRYLQCQTDSEDGDQRQRGRKIRFEVWLHECERVTVRASGPVEIAGERYRLKRKTTAVGPALYPGYPTRFAVRPKGKHRRKILAALKDGRVAYAQVRLEISDPSGNSRTTGAYEVRLARG